MLGERLQTTICEGDAATSSPGPRVAVGGQRGGCQTHSNVARATDQSRSNPRTSTTTRNANHRPQQNHRSKPHAATRRERVRLIGVVGQEVEVVHRELRGGWLRGAELMDAIARLGVPDADSAVTRARDDSSTARREVRVGVGIGGCGRVVGVGVDVVWVSGWMGGWVGR